MFEFCSNFCDSNDNVCRRLSKELKFLFCSAGRNTIDSFLDTVIHIIRSLRARNSTSLSQVIQKMLDLDSSLQDQTNNCAPSQSNRKSNFRTSTAFYQLFQKVASLIPKFCQGDLSSGSSSPRQTIQNLFRFLALSIEMLFHHHSGGKPVVSGSGLGQLGTWDEESLGDGGNRKSSGMPSSWEVKECCQSLCKLCLVGGSILSSVLMK